MAENPIDKVAKKHGVTAKHIHKVITTTKYMSEAEIDKHYTEGKLKKKKSSQRRNNRAKNMYKHTINQPVPKPAHTTHKLDVAQKRILVDICARFGVTRNSRDRILTELARCGILIADATLCYYLYKSKTWRNKILKRREEVFSKPGEVPISIKGYRLEKLQEIVENEKVSTRERISALKEARIEIEASGKGGPSQDTIDALPPELQARLLGKCRQIIDAEYEVLQDSKIPQEPIAIEAPHETTGQDGSGTGGIGQEHAVKDGPVTSLLRKEE